MEDWTDQVVALEAGLSELAYEAGWLLRWHAGSKSSRSMYFDAQGPCPCQRGEECEGCVGGVQKIRVRISDHASTNRQEHYSLVLPPGDPADGDTVEDIIQDLGWGLSNPIGIT